MLKRPLPLVIPFAVLILVGIGLHWTPYRPNYRHLWSYAVPNSPQETYAALVHNTTPADSFRHNLRADTKYVTTWNSAGMTNVFQGYVNLIYLAFASGRVAVIPPLAPSPTHLGGKKSYHWLNFGRVFDIPRLSVAINSPLLEWADLKRAPYNVPWNKHMPPLEGVAMDEIGCWSLWEAVKDSGPQRTYMEQFLRLGTAKDVSYTPVPVNTVIQGRYGVHVWGLVDLFYERGRSLALAEPGLNSTLTPHSKVPLLPDDHLTCLDDLHIAHSWRISEWEYDMSPAWRFIGLHTHFTGKVEEAARRLIRRAAKLGAKDAIPPFIAIHARRHDIVGDCLEKMKNDTYCYAPLSVYANRVREVREELQERYGVESPLATPQFVIVTSDEKDPKWWNEVAKMGWLAIDHASDPNPDLAEWQPTVMDSVIQSMAIGFVGSKSSSFSLVSALRVRDWNGGAIRSVSWNHGKGG
ncbi:hypothetical protein FRB99_007365 [Tulasnella sp. 403]|nr:hypothetical protein FRB99_007365 [Tulasnella sp. 403]